MPTDLHHKLAMILWRHMYGQDPAGSWVITPFTVLPRHWTVKQSAIFLESHLPLLPEQNPARLEMEQTILEHQLEALVSPLAWIRQRAQQTYIKHS